MKALLIILCFMLAAASSQAQELKPFERGSKKAILAAHQGEPFILALWSLDCTYCHDDLEMLGKLQTRHQGLKIVLVATDTPTQSKEILSAIKDFHLQRAEPWVFADQFTERLRNEVDPQWYGEMPRLYFFDAAGKSTAVSGKIEQKQIEKWIKTNKLASMR
jgi:thiol-disulfide isomerase/thioredoxin